MRDKNTFKIIDLEGEPHVHTFAETEKILFNGEKVVFFLKDKHLEAITKEYSIKNDVERKKIEAKIKKFQMFQKIKNQG